MADDDDDSDRVIPWTALASSQSKTIVLLADQSKIKDNLHLKILFRTFYISV